MRTHSKQERGKLCATVTYRCRCGITGSADFEPVDFRQGQRVTAWPDGFDPARLPQPEYRDGDRVQFVRDETCAREGVVRMVMLGGGVYGPLDRAEELIEQWYCQLESMLYIVTARGHDHRLRSSAILGQFVSRNRWER